MLSRAIGKALKGQGLENLFCCGQLAKLTATSTTNAYAHTMYTKYYKHNRGSRPMLSVCVCAITYGSSLHLAEVVLNKFVHLAEANPETVSASGRGDSWISESL